MSSGDNTLPRRKPIVSVVDDDSAICAALTDLLDSAGCESYTFGSAEQFLESGAANVSNLVITDIQMGKLGGLDLLARLRATPGPLPIIVITALADERLERRAIEGGCFTFLRKPFNPDTLLRHIRNAIALT